MKPIQLKLAGLQSYREEQVIDFSELCDAGVFGIFGPTGSGKSSILDAITLALYGKVERAQNGTQGIMNHAEQMLSVSFTFELTSAAETKRYRVERQFKRSSDVSISNTISRFIDMQADQELVLADKHGEVNDAVQQLLGLSLDDFTRAVVLPQGKFAEFLYLKGIDRRRMLQRLFNLEKYGDILQGKLNGLAQDAEVEFKQLSAEQQGLGDASAAAVQAAQDELQKAEELAKHSRKQLAIREKQYKHDQQIWAWQTQKESAERQLEQLKASVPDILSLEQKVQRAEQAERLRPYVEQWDAAMNQVRQSSAQLEQVRLEQAETKRQYDLAREAYETAEQQREANEAPLLIQLNDYKQALQLEKELIPLQATLAAHQDALEAGRVHVTQRAEALQKERDSLQRAREEHKALQQQHERYSVPSETVRRMQAAYHDKKTIDKLQLDLTEWQHAQQREASQITRKKEALAANQLQHDQCERHVHEAVSSLLQALADLHRHNKAVHSLLLRVNGALHMLEQHEAQHALQQHAIMLAKQLEAGQMCPVCGATDHPQLASAQPIATDVSHASQSAMRALLDALREHLYELKEGDFMIRTQLQGLTSLPEPLPFELEDKVILEECEEEAPRSEWMSMSYSDALHEEFSQLSEKLTQITHFANEHSTILKAEQEQLQSIWQRQNEQLNELNTLEAVFNHTSEKVQNIARELEELQASWHDRYPDDKLELFDEHYEQWLANEKRADELKEQLRVSEQHIKHLEDTIQQLQQRLHEDEKELIQLTAQWERTKDAHEERTTRLKQWIGDSESADQLIEMTEHKLLQLRQAVQLAKEQFDLRREQLEAVNSRFSAAEQSLTTAGSTEKQAKQQLEQHIAHTSFPTSEALREAFADEETIRQWSEQIKAHRTAEQQLTHQINQLEQSLAGEQLSEQQWMDCQTQLELAKEQVEMALGSHARAGRDVEDVLKRHERWAELEAKSKEVRHYIDLLNKLRKVFRGNAFVEYVAEEQLIQVSRAASERLGELTRQRYAIEVDSGGGFIIRDDANGGVRRPASSLSGGEAFLTSLALALALSAQIQLGGQYALEFFFLDEGFGTLDQHMLEGVMTALEKLHSDHLNVGVISHVPQLRAHLPRKLIVHPAEPSGRGSTVTLETI